MKRKKILNSNYILMIASNFKDENLCLGTRLTDDDLNTWHTGRDEDYRELTLYEENQPIVKGMRYRMFLNNSYFLNFRL